MTDVAEKSLAFMQAAERTTTRGTTLYALSEEYTHLVDLLEDPDVDPHLVEQELERIGGAIVEKIEAIGGLIRWYEGLAAMRRAEAKRMNDAAERMEARAEWLRGYVLRNMKAIKPPRIDTGRFTFAVRQNPPRVEVLQEMMVPAAFKEERISIHIDKRKILEHFKTTGELVPGTEIMRGERLDIR